MTSPETVLARATAKGVQYEAYVGGGLVSFTPAEVGYALSGLARRDGDYEPLPDGAVRILLLRYADGQDKDVNTLVRALVDDGGKQMDWVSRTAHTLVCRLAVDEFLHAIRCVTCGGRTTVMHGDLVEPCTRCNQSGYEPYSAAKRAFHMGLPVKTFRAGPAERMYLERMHRLSQWEQIGLRRVASKTRSRD